jgi:hypothetical protein
VTSPPQFLFGPSPDLTPGQAEQLKAAHEAHHELEHHVQLEQIAQRRAMLRWAPVICSCRPWPQLRGRRDTSPPQGECLIHGNVMVTLEGEVL